MRKQEYIEYKRKQEYYFGIYSFYITNLDKFIWKCIKWFYWINKLIKQFFIFVI